MVLLAGESLMGRVDEVRCSWCDRPTRNDSTICDRAKCNLQERNYQSVRSVPPADRTFAGTRRGGGPRVPALGEDAGSLPPSPKFSPVLAFALHKLRGQVGASRLAGARIDLASLARYSLAFAALGRAADRSVGRSTR